MDGIQIADKIRRSERRGGDRAGGGIEDPAAAGTHGMRRGLHVGGGGSSQVGNKLQARSTRRYVAAIEQKIAVRFEGRANHAKVGFD